jgi:5,10-methylenetetrahydromethanopterin reductase
VADARISFGIRIPPCEAVREVARAARAAEAGGFSHVWTLDSPFLAGRLLDPYLTLGACAGTTTRVRLGVAVTNAVSRHPLATACAALTLDEIAEGRTILGIGSGDSAMRTVGLAAADAQGTHGDRRARLRETIGILRAILAGEAVQLGERRFQVEKPRRAVPIYVAATGPRMLEMAGELADGVIIQVGIHRACVEWALEHIRRGAVRAGRDPAGINIVCSTFAAVGDDRRLAIDRVRPLTAWFYAVAPELVEISGVRVSQRQPARPVFPDISHAADHDEAMVEAKRYVADEAVEKLCLVGSATECVARIRELATLGVDQVFLRHYLTYRIPWELIAVVSREIIPAFQSL